MVRPLIDAPSRVDVAATETVYVSGASEMKVNFPALSVVVVDDWDGLVAVTTAPAMGACVEGSITEPLSDPVVPARTLPVPWSTNATISNAASTPRRIARRRFTGTVPFEGCPR